jgi:hypothetical protein
MFEFIDSEERDPASNYTIRNMCKWLKVNRSSYYDWKTRPESFTAIRRKKTALLVKKAFDDSDGTYGYRRIAAQLARWHHPVDEKVVRSIMADLNLVACQPRPWRGGDYHPR